MVRSVPALLRIPAAAGLALALAVTAAVPAAAQELTGDPARGKRFAEQVCSECHRVRESQESLFGDLAPDFDAVANTRGMTPMALRVWLQSPHPTMPDLILDQRESADVIAYIWSLRGTEWASPE